jgi:hypothetical protein
MQSLIRIILLVLIVSCSAKKETTNIDSDVIEIIQKELGNGNQQVYFRTLTEDQKRISGWVTSFGLNSPLCGDEKEMISTQISDEEIDQLKIGFESRIGLRLDKLVPEQKKRISRKWHGGYTDWISSPVIIRNGSIALIYRSGDYGSGFSHYHKIDGKWKSICYSQVSSID